ncbi:MAG TPA: CoA pyrophosphatase [Pyrinomonadaceae bacterium]|jgi:8-oxo-dGTP pyrophosphatase MutT (NUDIX family)
MNEFSSFVAGLKSRVGAGVLAPAPGPDEAASFEPREDDGESGKRPRQAAVALVLRGGLEGPEMLVIKRSEAERDHWSGHLALPGGRVEPEDENLLATAVRETLEEVGLDLRAGGEVLGRLGTVTPQSPLVPRISVTPFLSVAPREYHAGGADGAPKQLELSGEVAAAFWIPVDELKRGGRSAVFRMAFAGVEREWPGYPSEHGVIWGITERILTEFLSLVD